MTGGRVLTWHNDIFVVSHKVLQDSKRRRFNIDIPPIYPRVIWPKGRAQQPVSCLGHKLPPTRLCCKPMAAFNILVHLLAEIFLNYRNLAKMLPGIVIRLDLVEGFGEDLECRVFRIGDKEGQIHQVVRIGEVAEVGEEHGKVGLRITKRDANENALLPFPAASGPLHVAEVVVFDRVQLRVPGSGKNAQGYNGSHRSSWPDKVCERDDPNNAK